MRCAHLLGIVVCGLVAGKIFAADHTNAVAPAPAQGSRIAGIPLFRPRSSPPPAITNDFGNPAIAQAMASESQAIPRAEADPTRPIYHFRAPAFWMNDPNGPIYHNGYYHMFYQHNPYGDDWGKMHWGHARSRDLIHWQSLPIALWPSKELGEEHVFSGCSVINPKGQPMIFYTSIAQGKPAETYAEQWAALGSKDLLRWEKSASNPILTQQLHGSRKIYDWRDPFVFQDRGVTYMVLGGNLNERKGGQAVVNLYRATNDQLTQWQYLGVLFTHPDPKVVNIECPNFFKLGNHWVLVVSPHGLVDYFVGSFDPAAAKFTPQTHAILDFGNNYYAPNCLLDNRSRRIMWGWVKGFQPGHGWNGCLTVPRILTLSSEGELLQKPAPELRKLRTDHFKLSDFTLENSSREISGLRGDSLEIYANIELLEAQSFELQLRRSADGSRSVPIRFNGQELDVAGSKVPCTLLPHERTLNLDVFLDKSVLEVFANDRVCVTKVIYPAPGDLALGVQAAGNARVRSFHGWRMRSAW